MGSGGGVAGRIARGDIRLYRFAPPDKKRPVVVLTRDSAIAYLSTVTVAPITSTVRGVPSEVILTQEDGLKAPCAVNLHNAVTVSQDRLENEGNLYRPALLSGLRSQSAVTNDLCPLLPPSASVMPSASSGASTIIN
jgi:mRNA interferase MazF